MKKPSFIILFASIQIFLIFFYIHHQSMVIKLSFQKQKSEKRRRELVHKIQQLKQALHTSHDLAHIKEFATQSQMQKVHLNQIKPVPDERTT